ncbi:hypothetical protein CAI21_03780 [Alkalilimnicola ehrlichii]|uniref:Molybdopterin synthase sulfur carrier subunit n=1 Tax=Alkalilimnicola ehrlichii TaxID=351052 RepID=A0A3E0X178_9GAMM|nr:MoaD/ThiS family protein [Alkalilimnicola ehrlichii]RFA30648.1 hypothetical protein CAI21_03780 [Alkalilimnicola ehrlichii]RFA38227.1 hypothetical protein CAL65_05140 [Alkalilimnicola ehrlichii]
MEIQFYGVLQQVVGQSTVQLAGLPSGAQAAEVLRHLGDEYPELAEHLPRVACAQGDSLIRRDQPIDPNQALVLLPPVSGG